jgi:HSP20 family protein
MANVRSLTPYRDMGTSFLPQAFLFGPLQREIDRLFDDFTRSLTLIAPQGQQAQEVQQSQEGQAAQQGEQSLPSLVPRMDVSESDKEIAITVEMPGLQRSDVDITVDDDVLTIRGEKKVEREEGDEKKNYHVSERSYGVFYRAIQLPPGVDPKSIQATMSSGVLKITIPKPARSEAQKIEVKEGGSDGQAKEAA